MPEEQNDSYGDPAGSHPPDTQGNSRCGSTQPPTGYHTTGPPTADYSQGAATIANAHPPATWSSAGYSHPGTVTAPSATPRSAQYHSQTGQATAGNTKRSSKRVSFSEREPEYQDCPKEHQDVDPEKISWPGRIPKGMSLETAESLVNGASTGRPRGRSSRKRSVPPELREASEERFIVPPGDCDEGASDQAAAAEEELKRQAFERFASRHNG
ncbi:hypothetical protein IAT40_007193 [Kwoniella sp. CBS 6097]